MCFCWRLFGFMVSRLSHPVKKHQLHLLQRSRGEKNQGSRKTTTFHFADFASFLYGRIFCSLFQPDQFQAQQIHHHLSFHATFQPLRFSDFLAVVIGTDLPHPSQRFSRDLWGNKTQPMQLLVWNHPKDYQPQSWGFWQVSQGSNSKSSNPFIQIHNVTTLWKTTACMSTSAASKQQAHSILIQW